jgi:hypothetical protein
MRWILAAAIAGLFLLTDPARAGGLVGLIGNDTGGIIPWSPVTERSRVAIASDHCARYFKSARITSVHRQYGDYIGFHCLFGPPRRAVVVTLY